MNRRTVDVRTFDQLYIGSVFVVREPDTRGKFVKLNAGCSVDELGHDAIFTPHTPVRLIGRAKISVIDYSN